MEEALQGSSETPQSNGCSENNSEMQQHEVTYDNLDAGLPIPKKFHCPHCPKVFARKSNVYRHCRISHNNSKVTEVKYDNLDAGTPQSNGCSENNSEMQQHEVKYDNLDAGLPISEVPEVGQIVVLMEEALQGSSETPQSNGCNEINFEPSNSRAPLKQMIHEYYFKGKPERIYFVCSYDDCLYKSASASSLASHKKRIHRKEMYTCEMCGYKCARKYSLTDHIKSRHEGFSYTCTYINCEKKYNCRNALRHHIKTFHQLRYKCSYCDKEFVNKNYLESHIWTHERPDGWTDKLEEQFDYTILNPLVDNELKSLKSALQKIRKRGLKLKMPKNMYYYRNGIIENRPFDVIKDKAASLLLFIPRVYQDIEEGKYAGHFVTTSQKNPYNWIRQQLKNCKNTNGKACIHLKRDINKGKKFDYMNIVVVAATNSPPLTLDVKFLSNHYGAVTNTIKKDPAGLTQFSNATKSMAISSIPYFRYSDF